MTIVLLAIALLLGLAATAMADDSAGNWSAGILAIGASKLRTNETHRR